MGLRSRILLLVGGVMAAFTAAVVCGVVLEKRREVRREYLERVEVTVDSVQRIGRESLRSRDDVMLLSYLKHLMKDMPYFELAVVTRGGYSSVLGEVRSPLEYRTIHAEAEMLPSVLPPRTRVGRGQLSPRETVDIQLGLSNSAVDAIIRRETFDALARVGLLGLAAFACGVAAAWWLSAGLTA